MLSAFLFFYFFFFQFFYRGIGAQCCFEADFLANIQNEFILYVK